MLTLSVTLHSTGAAEYNMMISKKRVAVVAAYIEEGIEADRITKPVKGKKNPIASNDTAEGRTKPSCWSNKSRFEYQEDVQVEEVIVETVE